MKTRLFTAVVGDILDTLGYMHQFVSPAIKPLDVNTVVAGRAMPVLESDVYETKSTSGKTAIGENRLASCLKRWMPSKRTMFTSLRAALCAMPCGAG
ncbi:hypothetical protein ACVV4I_24830 [Escherichia coli]